MTVYKPPNPNNAKITESTTVSAPLTLTGYSISIPKATGLTNGYLSSVDWAIFNSKLSSFTETDPIYTTSPASNIVAGDITNLSNLSGVNTGDQNLPYLYDAIVDASGNGDYLKVSTAVATESAGASIFIRNGSYIENTNIVLKSGQKIVGESREGVVIDLNGAYQLKAVGASGTHFTGILLDSFSITGATTIGIEQIYFLYVDKSIIKNVRSYFATNSGTPRSIKLYVSDYNVLDNVIAENGHSNFYIVNSSYNKIINCSSLTPIFENYNIQSSAFNTFVGNLAKGRGVGIYMRYTSDNNTFTNMTFDTCSNVFALYNSPNKTIITGCVAVNTTGQAIGEWLGVASNLSVDNCYLEGNVIFDGTGHHISNSTIVGSITINATASAIAIANSKFTSIVDNGIGTKLINNSGTGVTNKLGDIGDIMIDGGVRMNTSTVKPVADATTEGTFWVVKGGVGVADSTQVCLKSAADTYSWITLATG